MHHKERVQIKMEIVLRVGQKMSVGLLDGVARLVNI